MNNVIINVFPVIMSHICEFYDVIDELSCYHLPECRLGGDREYLLNYM